MTSRLAPQRGWITISCFPGQTDTILSICPALDYYLIHNKAQYNSRIVNTHCKVMFVACKTSTWYIQCRFQKSKLDGSLPIINSSSVFESIWDGNRGVFFFCSRLRVPPTSDSSTQLNSFWYSLRFFFVSREMLYAGKWAWPLQSCFEWRLAVKADKVMDLRQQCGTSVASG